MHRNYFPLVGLFLLFASHARGDDKIDYVIDIKPIFGKHCISCHGPTKQKAALRLDTGAAARKGDAEGLVIIPGKAAESRLMLAVLGTGITERMPADAPALSNQQIDLLRKWIEQGAIVPKEENRAADPSKHWAFVPPVRPAVPGAGNPIDSFLREERSKRGLVPAGQAPKPILIRRLYLDLIGLPPTPAQVAAFLTDPSPQAYETVVDQLLASPQYGERWGRHWLDVWRYSDWYGWANELRNSQKHLWRWRDWTVEALNGDKPYDRMIVEMLAGDELAPEDASVLRATGFLARNYYKFNRNVWLETAVEHTGKAFLGITLNCAKCHDHMYDPITQEDHYRFRAFFEPHQVRLAYIPGQVDPEVDGLARVFDADLSAQTYVFERGDEKRPRKNEPLTPGVPKALDGYGLKLEAIKLPIATSHPIFQSDVKSTLIEQARTKVGEAQAAKASHRVAAAKANLAALEARIAADQAQFAEPPASNATALAEAAHLAVTQASLATAEANLTDAVRALAAAEANAKPDQTASSDLTKKVAAAAKGWEAAKAAAEKPGRDYPPVLPTYPATSTGRRLALAKWITDRRNPLTARVAVNHIWLRHFGEPLVPSVFDFGLNGRPPTQPKLLDWLAVEFMECGWSMKKLHRLIVTSQAYQMDSASHGAAFEANSRLDPDNVYLWRTNPRRLEAEAVRDEVLFVAGKLDLARGGPDLDPASGLATYRRSLYYRHAPEKTMTFLDVFDAANPSDCYRRHQTIVPQQALALANSSLALDASKALAESIGKAPENVEVRKFVDAAYRRVLGRQPTEEEVTACCDFLGKADIAPERARQSLIHVLFNHHEFVTIR